MTIDSPKDRSRDARRQARMSGERHQPLHPYEENSIPFSVSPAGALLSDARQTLRDYSDMYTPEEKRASVEYVKNRVKVYKPENKRPLKDI